MCATCKEALRPTCWKRLGTPALKDLYERIKKVLENCCSLGITISQHKLEINTEVSFADFKISQNGVAPDARKLKAISEFPAPMNLTALHSLLGMVNQLSIFIPDLAAATLPI